MEIIALVQTKMSSDGLCNIQAIDKDKNQYNLKINFSKSENILLDHIYIFDCDIKAGQRTNYIIKDYKDVYEFKSEKLDEILRSFIKASPYSYEEGKKIVDEYINKIDNKVLFDITSYLVNKHHDKFFIYPAAAKMHHAYVGGLVHHCLSMLKMADAFIENYEYLDKDYLYSGIILHDIGKSIELDGPLNTSYSKEGMLIGHLVIGAMEINDACNKLGYKDKEEALILEHMLISHHGVPQFGAAKKPMTPEALALWYIDTIDSKFRVLGDELENTNEGSFTENIGVIDKMKIYKPIKD